MLHCSASPATGRPHAAPCDALRRAAAPAWVSGAGWVQSCILV